MAQHAGFVLRRLQFDSVMGHQMEHQRTLRKSWTELHLLRPDIRHRSKTRREIMAWLKQHKLVNCQDWVYAGYRGVDGQGKRHIFRIKDPSIAMLAKLTFS